MWKGLASKGIVDETQRNSEIIKVIWFDVVEDLTGSNKKKKKKKGMLKQGSSQMRTASERM